MLDSTTVLETFERNFFLKNLDNKSEHQKRRNL